MDSFSNTGTRSGISPNRKKGHNGERNPAVDH